MERNSSLAIASVFLAVSALKLLQPVSITVQIGSTGNATILSTVHGLYDYDDMLTVLVCGVLAGASALFIIIPRGSEQTPLGEAVLNDRRVKWESTSKTLKDNEMAVYQAILEAGGVMQQGELVTQVGLPKATVSLTLDLLESKGLVERRRRGMGNVILLR